MSVFKLPLLWTRTPLNPLSLDPNPVLVGQGRRDIRVDIIIILPWPPSPVASPAGENDGMRHARPWGQVETGAEVLDIAHL